VQKQIREAETVQAIARLRLVWAEYQKRVFLLSNLPVEMPVDHLIEFNELMPDRLEMELIKKGDLPLTPLGLEKVRPDLGFAGASARKLFQSDRSKASDPKRLLTQLPVSVRTTAQIASFKAGDKRKTTHHTYSYPKTIQAPPPLPSTPPGRKRKYWLILSRAGVWVRSQNCSWTISIGLSLKFRGSNAVNVTKCYRYL